MEKIQTSLDIYFLIIIYIISTATSYSSISLVIRTRSMRLYHRLLGLGFGAIAIGTGNWSIYFIGNLSLNLPIQMSFHLGLIILSIVVSVILSAIMLFLASSKKLSVIMNLAGSIIITIGANIILFTLSKSMQVDFAYNHTIFAFSAMIDTVVSVTIIQVMFTFQRKGNHRLGAKMKLALLLGLTTTGLQWMNGLAVEFYTITRTTDSSGIEIGPQLLGYFTAGGALLLIALTLVGIYVNQRLAKKDLIIEERERWYRSLYENHQDMIITVDTDGKIISLNPAFTRVTGMSSEKYLYKSITNLGVATDPAFFDMSSTVELKYTVREGEFAGRELFLSVMSVPVKMDGQNTGSHLIIREISEEKKAEEKIQHLAYHDELTGLPNRRKFNMVLSELILSSQVFASHFAVMMIDMDRFKMINDSLGHTFGDRFLQEVAERLSQAVEGLSVTVARMGGDEFTLLYEGWKTECDVANLAGRILSVLRVPYRLQENEFYVTASIGIAIYPGHGYDEVQLLKNCDFAMYEVKQHGKNGYRFYTDTMDNKVLEKIELEAELRRALERQEFIIHYQPQIRIPDGCVVGVEALVRWNHSTKGMIPPSVFIPVAEETGLIYELGTWVMREACRQMSKWHRSGGLPIPVSVNLSTEQFREPGLVDRVRDILHETGLPPEYLDLEITESMMMDASISTEILCSLADLGVSISLDDFGTGYSSLISLKLYPIKKLKIDRSFITHITTNDSDKAIVGAIISMARHLNMKVVAEGIETKEQLDMLYHNEGLEIQGYYFSKPLTAEDVEMLYLRPTAVG